MSECGQVRTGGMFVLIWSCGWICEVSCHNLIYCIVILYWIVFIYFPGQKNVIVLWCTWINKTIILDLDLVIFSNPQHIYVFTTLSLCPSLSPFLSIYIYVCTYVYVGTYVRTHACRHARVYVYVCMYAYEYIYIHVYAYVNAYHSWCQFSAYE